MTVQTEPLNWFLFTIFMTRSYVDHLYTCFYYTNAFFLKVRTKISSPAMGKTYNIDFFYIIVGEISTLVQLIHLYSVINKKSCIHLCTYVNLRGPFPYLISLFFFIRKNNSIFWTLKDNLFHPTLRGFNYYHCFAEVYYLFSIIIESCIVPINIISLK